MTHFKKLRLLNQQIKRIYWRYLSERKYSARQNSFQDSHTYWDQRYREGKGSGRGSYGELREFKAKILNDFVQQYEIASVIEFGCGDGNQLVGMLYKTYLGFDVSPQAIKICEKVFEGDETKEFRTIDKYDNNVAELTLSLDVIYHLVEERVYEEYMKMLFESSSRYVVIYSSNDNITRKNQGRHVRHRKFTDWVDANINDQRFVKKIMNDHPYTGVAGVGSHADFYIYEKMPDGLGPK